MTGEEEDTVLYRRRKAGRRQCGHGGRGMEMDEGRSKKKGRGEED